jgi:general secretion pathway protein E
MCNHSGYLGRVAIGEFFMIDEPVRTLLKNTDNDYELREGMKQRGMRFLRDQLIDLLCSGVTSLDEIIRVGVKEV